MLESKANHKNPYIQGQNWQHFKDHFYKTLISENLQFFFTSNFPLFLRFNRHSFLASQTYASTSAELYPWTSDFPHLAFIPAGPSSFELSFELIRQYSCWVLNWLESIALSFDRLAVLQEHVTLHNFLSFEFWCDSTQFSSFDLTRQLFSQART